jgi:hypothetical protein
MACIAHPPPIMYPPTDNIVYVEAYFPDPTNQPRNIKYDVSTKITNDVDDTGCVSLIGYQGEVQVRLSIRQPAGYDVKFDAPLHPFLAILSSDKDKASITNGIKRSFEIYCDQYCSSNYDSSHVNFAHRNIKEVKDVFGNVIISIPETFYAFKYTICQKPSGPCASYRADPGIKNGGYSFHSFNPVFAGLLSAAVLVLTGLTFFFFRWWQGRTPGR